MPASVGRYRRQHRKLVIVLCYQSCSVHRKVATDGPHVLIPHAIVIHSPMRSVTSTKYSDQGRTTVAAMIAKVFSLYSLLKTTSSKNVVFMFFKDLKLFFISLKFV